MSDLIRPEISKKSKYWISKEQYYELKHFCLQYEEWKKNYLLLEPKVGNSIVSIDTKKYDYRDPVVNLAIALDRYKKKIKLVEEVAKKTDDVLGDYILEAVTKNKSYTYLSMVMDIPCSKETYYKCYRRFFWLLSKER